MTWQPIESAPKDGTAVWIWLDGQAYIGFCRPPDELWHSTESWFVKAFVRRRDPHSKLPDEIFGTYAHDVQPTLWQPLPDPPVQP